MSIEAINVTTKDYLRQEYMAEWRITKLSCIKNNSIQTPNFCPVPDSNFCPLPDSNPQFCFEISHQKTNLTFKVVLSKLTASEIQPSLKVEFDVIVECAECSFLKEYNSSPRLSVDIMKSVTCLEHARACSHWYTQASNTSTRYVGSAVQSDAFILKLQMRFFGYPTAHPECCRSLNNLKKFTEDFSELWKLSALSDVTIQIDGKNFRAHKAVLAAHSPVFLKMMESGFLESKTNEIVISDFKCDIFEYFLKYIYSGEIKDKSWCNIRELYILADKYDVQTLTRECIEIIGSFMSVDKICEILILAYDNNDSDLKNDAKHFAVTHYNKIVRKEEWYELVISHPVIVRNVMKSVYFTPKNVLKK